MSPVLHNKLTIAFVALSVCTGTPSRVFAEQQQRQGPQQEGHKAPAGENKDAPIAIPRNCPPARNLDGSPQEGGIDAASDAKGDTPPAKGPDHLIWDEKDANGRLSLYCVIDTAEPSNSHYQLVWTPTGGDPVMVGRCPFPRHGEREGYGENIGTKTRDAAGNVVAISWTSRAVRGGGYTAGNPYADVIFNYDAVTKKITTIQTDTDKEKKKLGPDDPVKFGKRDDHMPYPWLSMLGDPSRNNGFFAGLLGPGEPHADEAVLVPPDVYNVLQRINESNGEEIRHKRQWEFQVRYLHVLSGSFQADFGRGAGVSIDVAVPMSEWIRGLLVTNVASADSTVTRTVAGERGPVTTTSPSTVHMASTGAGITLARHTFWNLRPKASVWVGAAAISSGTLTAIAPAIGTTLGAQLQLVPHWSADAVYQWQRAASDPIAQMSSMAFGLTHNW